MATFTADAAQSNVQPRFNLPGPTAVRSVYSASVTLAGSDVIQLFRMPPNSRVIHLGVYSNRLADIGNAGFSLGDTGNSNRYVSTRAVLVTGGILHEGMPGLSGLGVDPFFFYSASSSRTIILTIETSGRERTGSAIIAATVVYGEV